MINEDKSISMIEFKYKPTPHLSNLISTIVKDFNGTMPGLLPPGYSNKLNTVKIYATCHPCDINGITVNKDLCAVVARNDYDAIYVYTSWFNNPGSIIGILEEDASKAKVVLE